MYTKSFKLTLNMVGLRALSGRVSILNEDPWVVREEIAYVEGTIRRELETLNYRIRRLMLVKAEIDRLKVEHIRGYHNVH